MHLVFLIIIITCLLSISIQDFKFRLVDIYSFIIFLLSSFLYSLNINGIHNTIYIAFIPFLFIVFLLLVITLLYSLKEKKIVNIFDTQIGWGDVFFWIGLMFLFSIANFLIFYILSIVFISLFSLLKKYKTIPLAGGQAVILLISLLINKFFINYNLYNDLYLINYLF